METFSSLFSPVRIGKVELRNRLVMLPMTTGYTEADESVGSRFIDFFEARARGGAGLIIVPFSPVHAGSPVEPGLYDDRFIAGARGLTDRVHRGGAKISAQLIISYHMILDRGVPEVVGPSPVMNAMLRVVPRELTAGQIRAVVDAFGQAARRAREAGFDIVEILVGGGYLLNRFLSPLTNARQDRYGGSLENRMRIILEVIGSIRKAAGEDFPVMVRLNLEEQMQGGYTIDDALGMAQILEKAGVAGFTSYTGWHESPVPTVQAFLPKGAFVHLSEKLKGAVRLPVIASNRISDPFTAEAILAGGKADLVGMGRALLADPELPNKAREGRSGEIVPCIACSNCLNAIISTYKQWGQPAATFCTVNPLAGREATSALEPAAKRKKVMVIGSGPAGLEAARVAALRGHDVTLYERGKEAGGKLLVAAIPPHKEELGNLARSLAARALRAGAKIRLGQEVDRAMIEREKPDALVVAVGAAPLVPGILGAKGGNVVLAEEVLTGRKSVSGSVLVIGGGMVGCETAEHVLQRSDGVTGVTVLEMLDRMANDVSPTYRPFFLARLKKEGIRMVPGAKVVEIGPRGVRVEGAQGQASVEGNTVVLAAGYKADSRVTEGFGGIVAETYVIGDCASARMIREALEEGFATGRTV